MGKKEVLKSLPVGDYEVAQPKVLKELPPGDYDVTPQKSSGTDYSFIKQPETTDEIISNIPDISDNERQILKNLAAKGADTETLSNSIQTLQGTHPRQQGLKSYYIQEEDGMYKPMPLNYYETPKDKKLAETVFKEKPLAEELKSSFERGAMRLADGILRAPEFLFDAAAEQNWNKTMRVAGRPDLEITSKKLGEETGIHNEPAIAIEQALEKRNRDFQNVYDKGITEYVSAGQYDKAAALLANSISESAPATIALALSGGGTAAILGGGAVFGAEKMQELEKSDLPQEQKLGIAAANGLLEGIFEQFGITKLGGIAKDIIKKEGKDAAKEFIEDVFKKTYGPTMGKYFGITAEESLGEMATQFSQNAVDKYSGYRPDIDLMDGVLDAGIVGLGAAAGPSVITAKAEKNKAEQLNERSKYIYDTVQKGPEAVLALKTEIDNAVQRGSLTPEQGEKAKFQADVYSEYNNQIGDLKLNDEEKREVYDLSYQKQGLQTEVAENVKEEDLTPIELAKRNGKQQQIKDLQKQIDEIVRKGQVKDEPVVADKTKKTIQKNEEKKNEKATDIISRYGGLKAEVGEVEFEEEKPTKSERRKNAPKFDAKDDKGVFEFNKQKPLEKKEIIHDYLDEHPELNNELEGQIEQGQNNVWQVNIGGRFLQFGRSIKPDKYTGDYENFPLGREKVKDSDGREYFRYTQPVGVKLESIKSDEGKRKRVLSIYNKQTGKHIVFAKEREKGNSNYSENEIKQLKEIQNKNYLSGQQEENPVFGEADEPTMLSAAMTKDQFIEEGINRIKESGQYDASLDKIYRQTLSKQYESTQQPEKISDNEREALISEGYDNATINRAEKKANELKRLSAKDLFKELQKIGVFNIGEKNDFRPNVGLNTKEYESTIKQLESGKQSKTVDKLLAFVEDIKQSGKIKMIGLTGGASEKTDIPLYQLLLEEPSGNRGLTEQEEQQELEKESAREQVFAETGQFQKRSSFNNLEFKEGELSPEEKEIESKLNKDLTENYIERKLEYLKKNGNIFDTDRAREFSKEYNELPELLSGATQIPAREFVGKMYKEELAKDAPEGKENEVLFMAGGSGVGKSTTLNPSNNNSHIVVDTNFSNFERAVRDVEEALSHGKKVKIAFIFRDPIDSFINPEGGVIHRSKRPDSRRTVPYDIATEINRKALKTIIELSEYFKNNSNVSFKYFNNSFEKGKSQLISLNDVKQIKVDFEQAKKTIKNEIERQRKEGKLNDNQYFGLTGKIKEGLERGLGKSDDKRSEPKRVERSRKIQQAVERLKLSFPKVKIVYAPNLQAAGKLQGNTVFINPDYAGIDTPIHEYGHILIDTIGLQNKAVKSAINQLKDTELWNEVAANYPELNEEMLTKEVLAEAIGREGANIFDKTSEQSKFMAFLSYLFDWFKTKLGLNKNVAKSLAKQIISGIGTKEFTGQNEQEQFAKKSYKNIEEMTADELKRKMTKSFEAYRADVLKRPLEQIRHDIIKINELIESDDVSESEKQGLKDILSNLKRQEKQDKSKWMAYKEDVGMISSVMSEGRLEDMPIEKLIDMYNLMSANFQDAAKDASFKAVMEQIAYRMFTERKEELKEYKNFVEEKANKGDLAPKDVLLKTLSHFTESFPELQKFSKMFDEAHFDMVDDRFKLKNTLEKLGKAVIREKNKGIGINSDLFVSNNAKYFDFVENSKEGRYWTLEEAKTKNFSPAQIAFLKFMHELSDLRNSQLREMGQPEVDREVLKVDKGVKEAFKTDGLLQAFSAYLGNGYNVRNVRINYNGKPTSYGEIEQDLIKKGNKGTIEKAKALALMLKYQLAARRQLKSGVNIDEKENPLALKEGSEYQLSTDGRLKSKFNKPRDAGRGYSKDFYAAAHSFIDDYTHVKHMAPLLPYIESIEHLNRVGFMEHESKENVVKWIQQWKDLHIFKKEKQGALGPEVDAFLRAMRKLTSLATMAFNIPAGGWNLAMGIYNNIRSETAKEVAIGLGRLFGGTDRAGYGAYNKKAVDLLKKYQVVSIDYDSNPKLYAGRLFDNLAHGVTRAGEFTIQGSMFLGFLKPEEYNSFEYKKNKDGVEELVVKPGVDEKELKKKFIGYKNRISDIQGKYSEKDRRNYMAGEFGKAVGQFKTWMPDWFKERFGERYIDRDDNEHMGSWRSFVGQGLSDLRADIKKQGPKAIWNNKQAMANLKGALAVAIVWSLKLADDDDEKKRRKADNLDKAMGNLLFVFDPESLEFTLKNPVAAISPLTRFVDALEDAMKGDFEKAGKKAGNALPYNKAVKEMVELTSEE